MAARKAATAAAVAGMPLLAYATSDDATRRIGDVAMTAAITYADYKVNDVEGCHARGASRLHALAIKHGGLLTKFGQHVGSLQRLAPPAYVSKLASLRDACAPSDAQAVRELLKRELGDRTSALASLSDAPIAAASIAQVHVGTLTDCTRVAMKIMHPTLETSVEADVLALRYSFRALRLLAPDVAGNWDWLLPEFEDSVRLELDFLQEAATQARCASLLEVPRPTLFCRAPAGPGSVVVRAPAVRWDLTTKRVLTMEFVDGHRVDDMEAHARHGTDPKRVGYALVNALSSLSCEHGLVHADPHAGNQLVSPSDDGGFTLWLLDHGLYRRLEAPTRRRLASLWATLACPDFEGTADAAVALRFGENRGQALAVARLFFTASSAKGPQLPLGAVLTREQELQLRKNARELFPGGKNEASELLERVPRDLLFTMRAASLLRGTHRALACTRRQRLMLFAEAAARGNALDERWDHATGDDCFSPEVRDAIRRCDRPHHPLNAATPSERARASRTLTRFRAFFSLCVFALRVFVA